jgi:hypothetical protein
VCGAQLRLVDLDGMFVPALRGRRALELGHRAYQHPGRSASMFDERIDRFSALAIYTSLKALAVKPSLWDKYHDENLIFTRQDYEHPRQSPALRDCRSLGEEVARLVDALTVACEGPSSAVPPLGNFVTTKPRKLPAWMHAVPPGSLTAAPRTREAGVGRPIAPVDTGAGTVREPPAPAYVAGSAPAPSTIPRSTSQSGGTASTTSTYTPRSTWGERFGVGFGKTFGALWWICVLALFSGNGTLILSVTAAVLVVALFGGLSRAAGGPQTHQRSPAPAPTTSTPSRPYSSTPRPTWQAPTAPPAPSPSVSPGGTVVASRIRSIYHRPSCEWALKMSRRNRITFASTAAARQHGYRACRVCSP